MEIRIDSAYSIENMRKDYRLLCIFHGDTCSPEARSIIFNDGQTPKEVAEYLISLAVEIESIDDADS